MANRPFSSPSVSANDKSFRGGLNSTAGNLGLNNTESSDLQNIDFDKFGSITKRNGYALLNSIVANNSSGVITAFSEDAVDSEVRVTSAGHGRSDSDKIQINGTTNYDGIYTVSDKTTDTMDISATWVADDATGIWYNTGQCDGLHWYEYDSAGTTTRKLINVTLDSLFKMDDLDGTWDDVSGTLSLTATNHCDFENFLNEVYIANGVDVPFKYDGSSSANMTLPTGLTTAKFIKQFNNYLFLANVTVSGTTHKSRIYWSNLKDTGTWTATDFLDVSKNDGQDITGLRVLSDRLVVYKTRSIYNVFFTGDSDIPFVLPGGGKSNSSVGCVAPFSIQEVENGHVFLSDDGFYFYDGLNSFKISDKINTTIDGFNTTRLSQARSLVQKTKSRYFCSLPDSGQTENDKVLVWDFFNNAWSVYDGIAASAMTAVFVSGTDERPYFADYNGFTYRSDTGSNDNPLGTSTAISAYYWTNWRDYDDLVNQKGIPEIAIYYQTSTSVLSLSYAFDGETGDQYTNTFSIAVSSDTYGSGVYGTAVYAGSGGAVVKRNLTGRGRIVRFKFENNTLSETFTIDGMGAYAHLETNV